MNDINPRVDIAFKKIFGVEENKDLLMSLINSIVSPQDQVGDLTLLNPYNPVNFRDQKLSILDIKARGVNGQRFNIEVQITDEADYDKRALYYWGKLYTEQLQTGDEYAKLSKAIGIHILNFMSIPDTDKYHNVFHITERDDGFRFFRDLELHTIELKKFTNNQNDQLHDLISKIRTSLDIWTAFLTRHDLLQTEPLPAPLDNRELKKALDILGVMNFSSDEREAYENHLKWMRIEASTLNKYAAKGHEAGMQQGLSQGRAEGRAEGAAATKLELAKKMLKAGLPIKQVALISGIDENKLHAYSKEFTV